MLDERRRGAISGFCTRQSTISAISVTVGRQSIATRNRCTRCLWLGTIMALPRITQKEMTEREQRELKTLLDRARIAHGRVLTNSETNSIKKDYIDKLMVEREAEAKKARQLKKKQAYKPDPEASFSWSANTSTRGRR